MEDMRTRQGPEYENDLYQTFIQSLQKEDILNLNHLSVDRINNLTMIIHPEFGNGRRKYWESLNRFINKYTYVIKNDWLSLQKGEEIYAPSMKKASMYISDLLKCIDSCEFQEEINKFIDTPDYALPLVVRKNLLMLMKTKDLRVLSRLLARHRMELVRSIKKFREGTMNVHNESDDDFQAEDLLQKLENSVEDGLIKVTVPGKGFGVRSIREFKKNEFLLEYSGELITEKERQQRDIRYAQDETIGCFLFTFKYADKVWCIDATEDNGRLGRWINHSKKAPNAKAMSVRLANGNPTIYFVAIKDIKVGEEILYDYGDTDPESTKNFPWLLE